jgi:hypothetical protein
MMAKRLVSNVIAVCLQVIGVWLLNIEKGYSIKSSEAADIHSGDIMHSIRPIVAKS